MEPLTRKEFFLNAIAEGTPTPPPLTREERYLAKIAENTGGGLPTIEEGDDGKVLTVSSGEAVWASGGGGGSGVTVVHHSDEFGETLDKTYNEILEAAKKGPVFIIDVVDSGGEESIYIGYLYTCQYYNAKYEAIFIEDGDIARTYVADTKDSYPVISD